MTSTDEILDLEVERDMDIEGGNKQDKCEVILHLGRGLSKPWGIRGICP